MTNFDFTKLTGKIQSAADTLVQQVPPSPGPGYVWSEILKKWVPRPKTTAAPNYEDDPAAFINYGKPEPAPITPFTGAPTITPPSFVGSAGLQDASVRRDDLIARQQAMTAIGPGPRQQAISLASNPNPMFNPTPEQIQRRERLYRETGRDVGDRLSQPFDPSSKPKTFFGEVGNFLGDVASTAKGLVSSGSEPFTDVQVLPQGLNVDVGGTALNPQVMPRTTGPVSLGEAVEWSVDEHGNPGSSFIADVVRPQLMDIAREYAGDLTLIPDGLKIAGLNLPEVTTGDVASGLVNILTPASPLDVTVSVLTPGVSDLSDVWSVLKQLDKVRFASGQFTVTRLADGTIRFGQPVSRRGLSELLESFGHNASELLARAGPGERGMARIPGLGDEAAGGADELVTVYHVTDADSAANIERTGFNEGAFVTTRENLDTALGKIRDKGQAPRVVEFQVRPDQIQQSKANPAVYTARERLTPSRVTDAAPSSADELTQGLIEAGFQPGTGARPAPEAMRSALAAAGESTEGTPSELWRRYQRITSQAADTPIPENYIVDAYNAGSDVGARGTNMGFAAEAGFVTRRMTAEGIELTPDNVKLATDAHLWTRSLGLNMEDNASLRGIMDAYQKAGAPPVQRVADEAAPATRATGDAAGASSGSSRGRRPFAGPQPDPNKPRTQIDLENAVSPGTVPRITEEVRPQTPPRLTQGPDLPVDASTPPLRQEGDLWPAGMIGDQPRQVYDTQGRPVNVTGPRVENRNFFTASRQMPEQGANPPSGPTFDDIRGVSDNDEIINIYKQRLAGQKFSTEETAVRKVTAPLTGSYADEYLTNVVHYERSLKDDLLYRELVNAGLDEPISPPSDLAGDALQKWHEEMVKKYDKLSDKVDEMAKGFRDDVLRARYGGDELKSAREALAERPRYIETAAVQRFNEFQDIIKQFRLGIDLGVTLQQGLKMARGGSAPLASRYILGAANVLRGADTTAMLYPWGIDPRIVRRADGLMDAGVSAVGIERAAKTSIRSRGIKGVPSRVIDWLTDQQYRRLNAARVKIYEGLLLQARMSGVDIASDFRARRQIADFANTITSTSRGASTPRRRILERTFLLSPQMTRSQPAEIGQLLKPLTARNRTSVLTFANQVTSIGAFAVTMYGINEAVGVDESFEDFVDRAFNPLSRSFGTMTLKAKDESGKNIVANFMPQHSFQNLFIRSIQDSIRNAESGDGPVDFLSDIGLRATKYGFGRTNFGISGALNFTGMGYGEGGEFHMPWPNEDRLSFVEAAERNLIPVPISFSDAVIEQGGPMEFLKNPIGLMTNIRTGLSFLGGNVYDEYDLSALDRYVQDATGFDSAYLDLPPDKQAAVVAHALENGASLDTFSRAAPYILAKNGAYEKAKLLIESNSSYQTRVNEFLDYWQLDKFDPAGYDRPSDMLSDLRSAVLDIALDRGLSDAEALKKASEAERNFERVLGLDTITDDTITRQFQQRVIEEFPESVDAAVELWKSGDGDEVAGWAIEEAERQKALR